MFNIYVPFLTLLENDPHPISITRCNLMYLNYVSFYKFSDVETFEDMPSLIMSRENFFRRSNTLHKIARPLVNGTSMQMQNGNVPLFPIKLMIVAACHTIMCVYSSGKFGQTELHFKLANITQVEDMDIN